MSRKVDENKFSSKFELLCTKTLSQEIHWSSSESEELEPSKHSRIISLQQSRKPNSSRKKPTHRRKSHLNNLEVSLIDRPKSPILTGSKRFIDELTLSPPPSPILKVYHDYPTPRHSKNDNSNSINIRRCEASSPILKSKISPCRSICGIGFRKRLKLDDLSNGKSKSSMNSLRPCVNTKSMICQNSLSDVHISGFSYIGRNEGRTSPILSTKLNTHNTHITERTLTVNRKSSKNDSNLRKNPILKSIQKLECKHTNVFTATNFKIKDVDVSGDKSIFNKSRKSPALDQFQPLGKENNEKVEDIRILLRETPDDIMDIEDKATHPAHNKHNLKSVHTCPILNTTIILETSTNKDSNRSGRKSPILGTISKKVCNNSQHSTRINSSTERILSQPKSKDLTVHDKNASKPRKYLIGSSNKPSQLSDNGSKIDLIAKDDQDTLQNCISIPQKLAVLNNEPEPIPNEANLKVKLIQKVKSFFDAQFSSQSASQNSIQETQSSHCQTLESTPAIDLDISPKTKSDSDVIVLESDNENKSSIKEVAELSATRSFENVNFKGRVMKKKYRKGGLADRLQNLVCKQNLAVSLWKHELYLAENTGFVVPANNFRLFRIRKCSFDFNITLLYCVSLDTDENYSIVLNNLVTKNLIICENSMLKLFEPFFELDVRVNEYRVIVNACKFQLIDVIKKERDF